MRCQALRPRTGRDSPCLVGGMAQDPGPTSSAERYAFQAMLETCPSGEDMSFVLPCGQWVTGAALIP